MLHEPTDRVLANSTSLTSVASVATAAVAQRAFIGATDLSEERAEEEIDHLIALEKRLIAEPSTGLADLTGKARFALTEFVTPPDGSDIRDQLVFTILNEVLALASGPAAASDPVFAAIAACEAAEAEHDRLYAISGDLLDEAPEWEATHAAHAAYWSIWKDRVLTTTPQTAAGCRKLATFARDFIARQGTDLDEDGPALLALIAASPLLGGPPPSGEGVADPTLVAMGAEVDAIAARYAGGPVPNEESDAITARSMALEEAMYAVPASSLADLCAKLPAFRRQYEFFLPPQGEPDDDLGRAAWRSLIADLERLAGSIPAPHPLLAHLPRLRELLDEHAAAKAEFHRLFQETEKRLTKHKLPLITDEQLRAYDRDFKEAASATGYTAASERQSDLIDEIVALVGPMMFVPATTLDVLALKHRLTKVDEFWRVVVASDLAALWDAAPLPQGTREEQTDVDAQANVLVDALEREWAAHTRQSIADQYDHSAAADQRSNEAWDRMGALVGVADALPATSRAARHAKALAAAWHENADAWMTVPANGGRDEADMAERLTFDIEAALTGSGDCPETQAPPVLLQAAE